MEAKEPRWKGKAWDATGRGQVFTVRTLGSRGEDLSLEGTWSQELHGKEAGWSLGKEGLAVGEMNQVNLG